MDHMVKKLGFVGHNSDNQPILVIKNLYLGLNYLFPKFVTPNL